tara:strand:- start:37076 stop:37402 length:327 start_codon:yes stop_codon:yes gene_type:complete
MPEQTTKSRQNLLIDCGEVAAETRADALEAAKPKLPSREKKILDWLAERGNVGATRHEIAAHFQWPLSSVCRPAQDILIAGLCVESGKRKSPYGKDAAVIILASCEAN